MDILDLEFFVEVQYDIFKILSPNNIYRSLPSMSIGKKSPEYSYSKNYNLRVICPQNYDMGFI